MKTNVTATLVALTAVLMLATQPATADEKAESRNSNIGLKFNLGFGSQDVARSQELEQGDAVSVSLGYGVSQSVSLWLGVDFSSHVHERNEKLESDLVGVEARVQYKLRPHKEFRPYAVIGVGTYFLGTKATGSLFNGNGVNWAVGAEYRLVRFLTVGLEFFWKDFDYTKWRPGEDGDFVDLQEPIQGNTRGFMINLTLH